MPENFTGAVRTMQRVALDVVAATYPASVVFGSVTGTEPLKIRLEGDANGQELRNDQLILTNNVRDYHVFLEAYDNEKAYDNGGDGYHVTENNTQDQSHVHNIMDVTTPAAVPNTTFPQDTSQTDHEHHYKGGVFKVKLGLKQGEKVVLLQAQGGQHWVVLDRKEPPKGEEGSD